MSFRSFRYAEAFHGRKVRNAHLDAAGDVFLVDVLVFDYVDLVAEHFDGLGSL